MLKLYLRISFQPEKNPCIYSRFVYISKRPLPNVLQFGYTLTDPAKGHLLSNP